MPRGFANSQEHDPRNFTLAEWQQAKRVKKDPRLVKEAFQDAWAISDSKAAFLHALEERGFKAARGDRRGFVAVDFQGEVYAIAKWAGIKTSQVRARLGSEETLPSVAEAKHQVAQDMLTVMGTFKATLNAQRREGLEQFQQQKKDLVARQRAERKVLNDRLEARQKTERAERQRRFSTGFKGLWDRLTGGRSRITAQNEREAYESFVRDRAIKEQLIFKHLQQRRDLEAIRLENRLTYQEQKQELREDVQTYEGMLSDLRKQRLEDYDRERATRPPSKSPQNRSRGRSLEQ